MTSDFHRLCKEEAAKIDFDTEAVFRRIALQIYEAVKGSRSSKSTTEIGGKEIVVNTISVPGGEVTVWEHSPFAGGAHSIYHFEVDKGSRGQGIGSELIDAVIATYPGEEISGQVSSETSLKVLWNKGFKPWDPVADFSELLALFHEESGSLNMRLNSSMTESKYKPLRTPRPDEPVVYRLTGYHSTTLDDWPSIRRHGLIPGKSDPAGQSWKGTWSGKGIYYHLTFPDHELDSGYDTETGEPWLAILECSIRIPAGYVVPDEEAGTPDETPEVIKDKMAIAVGHSLPAADILAVHLPDTEAAREWAATSRARKVVFHDVEPLRS